MSLAHIISNDGTISIMLNGHHHSVNDEHPRYTDIIEHLKTGDEDALHRTLNVSDVISAYIGSAGRIEVRGGVIYCDGTPLHNNLTRRILDLMENDFPFEPMLRFLENLMENPSARAVTELFDFLDHRALPITEDGCFLAYKGTRADGLDRYSGTIMNGIGDVIEIPRNKVDDNREQTCSYGLHVGTIEYVRGYCTERMVIVKVNPRDCVSVPRDHSAQKLRVCRYEILGLYESDLDDAPVYSSDGGTYEWEEDSYDVDFDDEDYEDEDMYVESDYNFDDYHASPTLSVPYGTKPDGSKYYALRDPSGRFTSK